MERSIKQYQNDMEQLALNIETAFPMRISLYKKQTLIQPANLENTSIWVLINGLAKQYESSDSDHLIVTGFWRKGDVIVQPLSFFFRQKAEDNIVLLEDSNLLALSQQELEPFEQAFPNLHLTSAIINVYRQRKRLYFRLSKMNTRDALYYLGLLYPLNRLNQKDVASFLGKDPSSLRRA